MPGSRFLWKLYLGYAVVIVLTTVVLGAVIASNVEKNLVEEIRHTLQAEAVLLTGFAADVITTGGDTEGPQARVGEFGRQTTTRFTIVRRDGTVLADSERDPRTMDNHRNRPELLEAALRGTGSSTRFSRTVGLEMMYVAVAIDRNDEHIGFIRAAVPLTYVQQRAGEVRRIVLYGALGASLLALLVGFFFARSFTTPLIDVTRAAHAIARGDYHRSIQLQRNDEIGTMAAAVNTMTDRLRTQIATISADRNRTFAILTGMVEGVIAVNDEERIMHINSAAEGILDIDYDDAMGRRVWEVTRVREVAESLSEAMKRNSVCMAEARIASPGGQQVVQVVATPLRGDNEAVEGAIVVLHDISELRSLEAVRRDFIANISHELKTPLTAIRGLVETMLDDAKMEPQTHREFLDRIHAQTLRISDLVVDLLTISRLESNEAIELVAMDFRRAITESFRAHRDTASKRRIRVDARVPDDEVVVKGDAESLRELVDNLLNNAIKYSPEGGVVQLRLDRSDDSAVLEVEDEGIGIAPEDQGRVFERFYRVDKARSRQMGGTGLGLSIVKHVALAHGGNVSLRSSPGRGSTFTVQIPLARTS